MVPRFATRHRRIRAEANGPWLGGMKNGQALQAALVGSILEGAGIEAILT
jgi:hypothetical protein